MVTCDSGRRRGLTIAVAVLLLGVRAALAADEAGNVEFLKRQVKYLSEALAAAKVEVDELRARLDRRAYEDAAGSGKSFRPWSAMEKKEYIIFDVNK